MGTIRRLNEQKEQQAQAEAAMPGAYDNKYDAGIQDALAGMDTANNAGLGFDSSNGTYRGALSRLFGNAGAGASAAEQVANSLSGGYGADWAKSAAQQAAAGETGQTANVYQQARADALSQWQQELAGKGTQLSNLLSQDQLARGEYDGSVADAANWRDYRYGRTEQARQENSDFWGNVWNVIQNVGNAVMEGYNNYKGYSQQKMAMDAAGYQMAMDAFDAGDPERAKQILKMYKLDETQVDSWTESYATRQSNTNWGNSIIEQATAFQKAGYPEIANQMMTDAGYDPALLETWGGLTDVQRDQMAALLQGADLAASGNDTAAKNYLTMAGLDAGSVDSYSTIANRVNQSELNKYASQLAISNRYKTTTGGGSSGRSSGSSGTSKSTGSSTNSKASGYTQPQLNTMFKEYSTMKPTDQRYGYYQDVLADAGRIPRLSGVGNPGKANGTAFEQGIYTARQMANNGSSQSQIASWLANNTQLSSDQISSIMNQMDYEWRGTK